MLFNTDQIKKESNIDCTGCMKCKLFMLDKRNKLPAIGKNKKNIFVLFDAPTQRDIMTQDFVTSGYFKKLQKEFKETLDIDLLEDCRLMHCVKCQTNMVGKKHIENCRKYVFEEIKKSKAKLIYAVGGNALNSLMQPLYKGTISIDMGLWRGWQIPHQELGCYVVPIDKPEKVSQYVDDFKIQAQTLWTQDIKDGFTFYDKKTYNEAYYKEHVKLLYKEGEILALLDNLILTKPKTLAFDYEATGLKPRRKGQEIVCAAFSDGKTSWSFPTDTKKIEDKVRDLLTTTEIQFIAHNMKYEAIWSEVLLGATNINIILDTCVMAHFLDNRRGITGLKFQTFVNFGIGDYSLEAKPFIGGVAEIDKYNEKSNYTHGNCFNKMKEMPLDKNLMYCGLDSLFTFLLAKIQLEKVNSLNCAKNFHKPLYGYDLLHKGTLALTDVENNGFKIDVATLEKNMIELTERKKGYYESLLKSELVLDWKKYIGERFNLDSGTQLGKYLFDYKRYPNPSYSDKGGYKTDAEALLKVGKPELNTLIEYKNVCKILDTFLKGIWYERNDDVLHASFNTNITASYRLSSSNPNLQNISKHKEDQMNYIRGCFVPHKGQYLLEVDYSALEIYGGLAYHKCPTAKKYLIDPDADQHSDSAGYLFFDFKHKMTEEDILKTRELLSKPMRSAAKTYNFATAYGSYWKNTSTSLWEQIPTLTLKDGTPLMDHLKKNGVTTFKQWQEHVKEVDRIIWEEKFKLQNDWKKRNYRSYQKKGYFDSYSGFRYRGMWSKNNVNNYSIQGFSAHVVVYDIIKLNELFKLKKLKSQIVCTVHDSIVFSIQPEETNVVLPLIKYIMDEAVFKHFPYFDVPSHVDFDATGVDEAWNKMEAVKYEELLEKYNDGNNT